MRQNPGRKVAIVHAYAKSHGESWMLQTEVIQFEYQMAFLNCRNWFLIKD